jgi:inosine-uridine nucleoside N-ribohydrolase
VPVYVGRSTPVVGSAEFPADWRRLSDELPGVELPMPKRIAESTPAHDFLASRLAKPGAVTVLALGPLTNLAEAFRINPAAARTVDRLVIMGGAIKVPGNLADGGNTTNVTAEWNFFIDPEAARRVFASGASIRLIPLDVTQRVPLDRSFQRALQTANQRALARVVLQAMAIVDDMIERGTYYAWDPLAAAAIVDPPLVRYDRMSIEIRQAAPEEGRTVVSARGQAAEVAIEVNPRRFVELYTRIMGAVRPSN